MVNSLSDPLVLKVYDDDAWASDDLMGVVSIDLNGFEADVPLAKWYVNAPLRS